MHLKTVFCAEHIILDANSGRVSCINVIDDITFPQFPAFLPYFSTIGIFGKDDGDPEEFNAELAITLGEQQLARGPILIAFQGSKTARTIVGLGSLVFPQPGVLEVKLVREEEPLGLWTVNLGQAAQNEPNAAPVVADAPGA